MMFTMGLRAWTKKIGERTSRSEAIPLSALLFLLLVSSTGCVKISGSLTSTVKNLVDFKKSAIIVRGVAIANGSDPLTVYVRLMNSDNSVVTGFVPKYAVVSGDDVLPTECFASDNTGLSICVLKAITPGSRTMKISNVTTINLEQQVTFVAVPNVNHLVQIVSGSNQDGSAGTYKVRGTVGNTTSTMKQTSSVGNYTLFGSVQASILSKTGSLQ